MADDTRVPEISLEIKPINPKEERGMQETAEEYRARMLGNTEGKNPVTLLANAPKRLEKLLKGVSPAKLRKRPAPGKWSVSEIVAHMADADLVVAFRIRLVLGAPGIQVQAFDQDTWVTALHYDKRDTKKSFEQFRAVREATVALLKSLDPEQWKLSGIHTERGEESVETIVRMAAGHDINHIRQVEQILKR